MKPRIFILACDSPADPCGGLGERLKQLFPYLREHYDLTFFAAGKETAEYDYFGSKVYTFFRPIHMSLAPALPMLFLEHILSRVGALKPDIVFCCDDIMIRPALILKQLFGAKFVLEFDLAIWGFYRLCDKENLAPDIRASLDLRMEAERMGIEQADAVITCSEYYKRTIPIQPKEAPVAVPNGIDSALWAAPYTSYAYPGARRHNLAFMGRLHLQKGILPLLSVVVPRDDETGKFRQSFLPTNTAVHFFGGKRGSNEYDQTVKACEWEATQSSPAAYHHGWVSGAEKVSALKSAAAALVPSIHEPFGISALEAMAAGTPLICSRVDGLADFVSEDACVSCAATAEERDKFIAAYKADLEGKITIVSNSSRDRSKKAFYEKLLASLESNFRDTPVLAQSVLRAILRVIAMPPAEKVAMTERAKAIAATYTWPKAAEKMLGVLGKLAHA